MEDKKIELISAKGAMGVTEFALLYFPDCTPEIAYKRMCKALIVLSKFCSVLIQRRKKRS